jgi:hypothetical protein
MSAHDPQDQHLDATVPAGVPASDGAPSVRDLLASCAAARTVSTPPDDARPAAEPTGEPPVQDPAARPDAGVDSGTDGARGAHAA